MNGLVNEIKNVLGLLLIVLPAAVFIYFWCMHCYYESYRQQAQIYLSQTYYHSATAFDRQAMMEYYRFTDEDINPEKVLGRFLDAIREAEDGNNN